MGRKLLLKVGKSILSLGFQCILTIQVLILIGASPALFHNLTLNIDTYLFTVFDLTIRIFTLNNLTINGEPLFPIVVNRYMYSMRILGLGILVAFLISSINAYITLLFFRKRLRFIKKALDVLEAIPDLMIIVLLQMFVIMVFKTTGIKIAQVVTVGSENQTTLLPVLSISIPISFFLTKVIIHYVQEELQKNYIILAKSMGFSYFYILNIHVLRNIANALFGISKTIVWSMVSTMMVVEYLFNINGLLSLIFSVSSYEVFIISCILIFIPFFILYRTYEWISFLIRRENV